jgi:DNA-binding response OmpR family regulator
LYAEDDARMRALVQRGLTEDGHAVRAVEYGQDALDQCTLAASAFDVIVLDVMLPDISGVDVLRRLRQQRCQTPVLLLTAKDTHSDVIAGLDAGADDYLTKPFAFDVLLARLRALARRAPLTSSDLLAWADVTLDPARHAAYRAGVPLPLTPTEFRLLECLLRHHGRVVPRRALIESVWGFDGEVEDNTLDAFVRLLRHKMDRADGASIIQTIRGVGYKIGSPA